MLKKKSSNAVQEVNASSMADIAFLLLIFFLVTTTIASDKGLTIILPPKKEERTDVKLNERNVYVVLVNSRNQLLVEGSPMALGELRQNVKKFILNYGADKNLSDSPKDAAVSFKTDRGTKHSIYLRVYDEIKAAYAEIRAEKLGMSVKDYIAFDKNKARQDPIVIDKAKKFAELTNNLGADLDDMIDDYLLYDPKSRDKRLQRQLDIYTKVRGSNKITIAEKYYDVQKEFPQRISKAEPTKTE
jgi:biopolymer transport protein ExbD